MSTIKAAPETLAIIHLAVRSQDQFIITNNRNYNHCRNYSIIVIQYPLTNFK